MQNPTFSTPGDIYNATPPRILFGAGTFSQVAAEVERLGSKRAMVISTPGRSALAESIGPSLGDRFAGLLPEAVSQVPIELAIRGRQKVQDAGADCLISVGGGASIGLGKGIALELGIPIIAIPTTYSGSEMTGFCGITIDGVKRMHTSLKMLASTVIYDPELTLKLPPAVSAASAMNALAHCIDAVVVATCSPLMALAAAEGAGAIHASIARVVKTPTDVGARTEALYGAYLGGAALTGGFALQHGVAHVLGGSFNVAHGLSHALMLPHVAAYHARHVPDAMAPVARAMGVDCDDLGGAVFDLLASLELPTSLADIGFDEKALDRVAQITVETDNRENPAPVTFDVVRQLLSDAFHGKRP
ncbi:MAG: maleylacetate reductase [Comamonadaceae bacterium]|nr:MAG: maleylacetate reductase [Comamonadaceae bacterium]